MELNIDKITSQKGRIALVTGANNGIGFETTLGLAKVGYKVIMACRNIEKAAISMEKIKQAVPNTDIDILQLNLSDLNSVKKFAQQFTEKYQKN